MRGVTGLWIDASYITLTHDMVHGVKVSFRYACHRRLHAANVCRWGGGGGNQANKLLDYRRIG